MDNFLIDFNSPKQREKDSLLIPEYLSHHAKSSCLVSTPTSEEGSNPFDVVVSQVAAQAAAENDPFETVLNDAMSCQRKKETNEFSCHSESTTAYARSPRKSLSLSDLHSMSNNTIIPAELENFVDNGTSNEHFGIVSGDKQQTVFTPTWNSIEDILPPDSWLNSTVDVSCVLDDTLSTSILNLTGKENADLLDADSSPLCGKFCHLEESSDTALKSENELRELAQRKIESLINKVKLDVQNSIQESCVQRRHSVQNLFNISEDVTRLCTPRSLTPKPEPRSWNLDKWSENQLKDLDLILPDSTLKSSLSQKAAGVTASLQLQNFKNIKEVCSVNTPGGSSLCSVLRSNSLGDKAEATIPSKPVVKVTKEPIASPVLLPLPLCEDAVRNLSLCSKFSPTKETKPNPETNRRENSECSSKELFGENNKLSKLTLRKSVNPAKSQSKLAPMKATAPVQNMTRTKSSLSAAPKSDINRPSGATRKSVLGEADSKMVQHGNVRESLRMALSPRRPLSGSLPNLSIQASKPPTRLPSPRRVSGPNIGSLHAPINLKKRFDCPKDKILKQDTELSSNFHPSPRPLRKSSPLRTGSNARVLSEINSSTGVRKSPKRRGNHGETPRRGAVVTEKENYV